MGSDDLTTRLLVAIEAAEKPTHFPCGSHLYNPHPVMDLWHPEGHLKPVDPAILRRCAADRKIVGLHNRLYEKGGFWDNRVSENPCETCGRIDRDGDWVDGFYPCDTLIALAEGYGLTIDEVPDGHHDH